MISLKQGTSMSGIKPEILIGFMVLVEVLKSLGYDAIITSCTDGEHSSNSLHRYGLALDVRSKHMERSMKWRAVVLFNEMQNGEYDLILEAEGKVWEHFHLEWDPKS